MDLSAYSNKAAIHEQLPTNQLAIYIHVPFCRARCVYCAFNTYVGQERLIEPYVQAVAREMRLTAPPERQPAATVYFGGGTPSLLAAPQVETLLQACDDVFGLAPDAEITLEVNPGSANLETLTQWRARGVNRISIGMQSARDAELRSLGRTHAVADVHAAVALARQAGFDNVSLDLIYGLPHQTRKQWRFNLDAALALHPTHLSLYSLSIEDATPLQRRVAQGLTPAPDPDLAADMYEIAAERLDAAGFEHYEISNWAQPGHACRHNVHVWRNLPYLGFGAGAHGCAGHTRWINASLPADYVARVNAQQAPTSFPFSAAAVDVTPLDQDDVVGETLILGLRLLNEGIAADAYRARFGEDLFARWGREIERLCAHGLLTRDAQRILLTPRGRLLSNRVFAEFI